MAAATIRGAIQEALSRWAAVAPLHFVEVVDSGPAVSMREYSSAGRPMIRFGHRPIDGQWGTLAYAFYPGETGLSGDIHFDTAENWRVNPLQGTDLLEVATHEIGHALGLAHSQYRASIMAPTYAGYYSGLGTSFLYTDDIRGIQALYGVGKGSVKPLSGAALTVSPFRLTGDTLVIRGTGGNDTLVLEGGTTGKITLNGVEYNGDLSKIRNISFNALGGTDTVTVVGTSAPELFQLRPGYLSMTGPIWNVTVTNHEVAHVRGGADDVLQMTGSTGNDTWTASATESSLSGPGVRFTSRGFGSVAVFGGGGKDLAKLYDSPGDDVLNTRQRYTVLSGAGYSLRAEGFTTVYAYASTGEDQALVYDTGLDDVFLSSTAIVRVTTVKLGMVRAGYGFKQVQVFASRGRDVAYVYGTKGDDEFIGTPTYSSLTGEGYMWEGRNLDQIFAYGGEGNDRASLYDSAGNDLFQASGAVGTLTYPESLVRVSGYAMVELYGVAGGGNRRSLEWVGFFVDWFGSWR